ncbi:MAG: hypothetical protein AMXMBFR7_33060 [Planctomycetota bacterium]
MRTSRPKDIRITDPTTGRDITRFGTGDPKCLIPVGPKVRDVKIWYDKEGKLRLEIQEIQPPSL